MFRRMNENRDNMVASTAERFLCNRKSDGISYCIKKRIGYSERDFSETDTFFRSYGNDLRLLRKSDYTIKRKKNHNISNRNPAMVPMMHSITAVCSFFSCCSRVGCFLAVTEKTSPAIPRGGQQQIKLTMDQINRWVSVRRVPPRDAVGSSCPLFPVLL